MQIVLVSNSLGRGGGGAERVMATLANHWAARGWDVSALTYDDGSISPHYALDSRIVRRPLSLLHPSGSPARAVRNAIRRAATLRREIRSTRPDVVVSFGASTNADVLAAVKLSLGSARRVPVIVSDRNDPLRFPDRSRLRAKLRDFLYRRAAAIVFQTERAAECFPADLRAKGRVIGNPVVAPTNAPDSGRRAERPTAVAMGRLEEQKGFDLLLQAFARIRNRHPDWKLDIVGEGSQREKLESLRNSLGIDDVVSFPGATRNPEEALRNAEMFVLSSRFEGFPNVLCEAMACGLPVVAADCRCGPREIVRDGVDGLLVRSEDAGALAAGMEAVMADAGKRALMGTRAAEITERFGAERILGEWDDLVESVVGRVN